MPIWEKQESDTVKSWQAFVIYRDMGPQRSLQKAHDEYYVESRSNLGQFSTWSVAHNWVARCQAYDDYQYEQHQERKQALRLEVEETLVKDWRRIRKIIEDQLSKYEAGKMVLKPHEVRDLIKMHREADDMIRRTAGLPDRISENKTDVTSDGKAVPIAIVKMDIDAL